MDLAYLNITALYIPTPGQPEQEYLADWIQTSGLGIAFTQEQFQSDITTPFVKLKTNNYNLIFKSYIPYL